MTTNTETTTNQTVRFCRCGCGQLTTKKAFAEVGHGNRWWGERLRLWRETGDPSYLDEIREFPGWLNVGDQRTFGIEVECFGPGAFARNLVKAMRERGLTCETESYNHQTREHWKIVSDGSIYPSDPNHAAVELVSPILKGKDGFRQIQAASEALRSVGARVNRSCGLHVHFGAGDLTARHLATLYTLYQQREAEIDQMVAKSRRGSSNHYCLPLSPYTAYELRRCPTPRRVAEASGDRYHKLNLSAYLRHGTVEFRHHQGTVEAEKIIRWIDFGLGLIRAAKRGMVGYPWEGNRLFDVVEMDITRIREWEARMRELGSYREAA